VGKSLKSNKDMALSYPMAEKLVKYRKTGGKLIKFGTNTVPLMLTCAVLLMEPAWNGTFREQILLKGGGFSRSYFVY